MLLNKEDCFCNVYTWWIQIDFFVMEVMLLSLLSILLWYDSSMLSLYDSCNFEYQLCSCIQGLRFCVFTNLAVFNFKILFNNLVRYWILISSMHFLTSIGMLYGLTVFPDFMFLKALLTSTLTLWWKLCCLFLVNIFLKSALLACVSSRRMEKFSLFFQDIFVPRLYYSILILNTSTMT